MHSKLAVHQKLCFFVASKQSLKTHIHTRNKIYKISCTYVFTQMWRETKQTLQSRPDAAHENLFAWKSILQRVHRPFRLSFEIFKIAGHVAGGLGTDDDAGSIIIWGESDSSSILRIHEAFKRRLIVLRVSFSKGMRILFRIQFLNDYHIDEYLSTLKVL